MSALRLWCVLYGAEGRVYFCEAEDRTEATEQCRIAHPAQPVHWAVPADRHGSLVLETQTDDPAVCPKCYGRTEMEDLPFRGWQAHVCLHCSHSFIAVPDEEEVFA